MSNRIFDGDFTTASAISEVAYDMPIPGVSTAYIATQDFCQLSGSFTPITIGTVHPTLTNFYLQRETALQPTTVADVMRWTRIYAKVPSTHSLPGTVSYNFIGFYGAFGVNVDTVEGRDRFTRLVTARIQFDYYRLGDGTYATISDIPILEAQGYYYGSAGNLLETDWLGDSPPLAVATTPTRTAYAGFVAAETEIVAIGSQLDLWLGHGNIVRRQTVYILPK